jgi:hypothetical protein
LSRLRAAIEELHAARRDIERKLAEYRTSLPWRFTLTAARRAALAHRVETSFAHDFRILRRQLSYLNATITAWEEDWTRPKSRGPHKGYRPSFRRMRRKF